MEDWSDAPITQILGVEHMTWPRQRLTVAPRPYGALAWRIRGEAKITTGGVTYAAGPGDILYLPQSVGYEADYTDTEILVFHFVTAGRAAVPVVYAGAGKQQICEAYWQAHSLWQERQAGYTLHAMALLYRILGDLYQEHARTHMPPHFIQAVSYLHAHFREGDLSTGGLCRHAGIGATSLRCLFRQYYNKTPVQYLTELRLEHARRLIAGGMPIEQAALESGFNDAKYFSRVVKQYYGCTPRAWRLYGH